MVSRPRLGLFLCAGGGGLDLGLMLAEPGFHIRTVVEWEAYPRSVLIAAQRAGYFAPASIWDDLRTFDARPFRGAVDIVLAGYPCQPLSASGKRGGADDPRHLWPDVVSVVGECQPEWVFLENVAGQVTLGLEAVRRELWGMGYSPANPGRISRSLSCVFGAMASDAVIERYIAKRWVDFGTLCHCQRTSTAKSAASGSGTNLYLAQHRRHYVSAAWIWKRTGGDQGA